MASLPQPERRDRRAGPAGRRRGLRPRRRAPRASRRNDEATSRLGVDDAWVERRTGIRERRWAAPADHLHELAAAAGRRALADAGVAAHDLDLVLVATVTADEVTPDAARRSSPPRSARTAPARSTSAPPAPASSPALGLGRRDDRGRARGARARDRRGDPLAAPRPGPTARPRRSSATAPAPSCSRPRRRADRAGDPRRRRRARRPDHALRATRGFIQHGRPRRLPSRPCAGWRRPRRPRARAADVELADLDLYVFHQANARILELARPSGSSCGPDRVVSAIARARATRRPPRSRSRSTAPAPTGASSPARACCSPRSAPGSPGARPSSPGGAMSERPRRRRGARHRRLARHRRGHAPARSRPTAGPSR